MAVVDDFRNLIAAGRNWFAFLRSLGYQPVMSPDDPIPISGMPGVRWPAVPSRQGALMLAMQYQLERTQWWPIEQLRAHQFEQIQPLLAHAYQHAPFYRDQLRKAGFEPQRDDVAEAWSQLPILTRTQLQEAQDTLRIKTIPANHGSVSKEQSSGSTGQPVTVYRTELNRFMWRVFTLREHLWHRRDFSGKLAAIRPTFGAVPPEGQSGENWGPSTATAFHNGPSAMLDIGQDIDAQRQWLIRQDPQYLLTFPTNLRELARCFRRHGGELPNLREVRTSNEMLPPDLRDLCRDVWGIPLTDMYSASEVAYMAFQCPDRAHYHVQCENVLLEVLDDDGRPCGPGGIGRIVVTALHNYASPLIRYEIMDYAEVGEPCPCGRGLPVLKRIHGRKRNMVQLPDGTQHWPSFHAELWADIAPIHQMQLVQHELDRVEAHIVMARKMTQNEQESFIRSIQDTLGYPFQIDISYVARIERSKGGKFEDFMSLVASEPNQPG